MPPGPWDSPLNRDASTRAPVLSARGSANLAAVAGRDTSREAREAQLEAQRRLGAAGRLALAFEMSAEARGISIAGMRRRNPDLSEAEAVSRLRKRLLGDELYAAAYERSTL